MAILELRHRAERLRRRVLFPVLIGAVLSGYLFGLAVGLIGILTFVAGALPVGIPGSVAYWLARKWMRSAWLDEFSQKPGAVRSELAKHATRFS
jgi:hypothetical protein